MSSTFPVLWQGHSRTEIAELRKMGCPRAVPWDFVAPHEAQAQSNHDQTLKRLAERGGLSPSELFAVVTGQGLDAVVRTKDIDKVSELLRLLAQHEALVRVKPPPSPRCRLPDVQPLPEGGDTGWFSEWPEKEGFYFIQGHLWRSGAIEMRVCQVRRTSNSWMYTCSNSFLSRNEQPEDLLWRAIPEPPPVPREAKRYD